MQQVLAVVGPTAVGKSETADLLASKLGGEVLSCDSMQVYRRMDIGTAKAKPSDCRAPLKLIDIVDPGVAYSAALYQRDARAEVERCLSCSKTPVFCGGTGLYLMAAIDCMDFPSGDAESGTRSIYQAKFEADGAQALYELLVQRDPASAAVIHPNNSRRVIRALEMADEGVSYAEQKAGFTTPRAFYKARMWCLSMDRKRLYERIDKRVDSMMQAGLLEEVESLVADGYKDALTSMQAIGYKELIQYLEGEMSLTDAVELIKRRSRRYAKRQLTWFRRDKRIAWIDMDAYTPEQAVDMICEAL